VTTPSISVVIPTYKRRHLLPEVLGAIGADRYAHEIIVIVDGWDDGSLEYIQDLALTDPRFRPIWQENSGEAVGRQKGATAATGDVVLFMDDDVVAGPDLARKHAEVHATADNLVVVGYMPTRRPAASDRTADSFTTTLYADEYERTCEGYRQHPDDVLRGLWAGNISLRREHALSIGHDPGYRLAFHEDQDFGLRCLRGGLRGVFDERLHSEHIHKRGRASFMRQAYESGSSRRFLEREHAEFGLSLDPTRDVPGVWKSLIKVGAGGGVGAPIRKLLDTVSVASSRVGLLGGATAADRLLRQIELRRGWEAPESVGVTR